MKEKIETLIKKVGVNPKNVNVWGKKSIAFFHTKEYEKAIECFDKSLGADPENIGILSIKALAFYKLKKFKKQRECLSALLLVKPKDEFDWRAWGEAIGILEDDNRKALEYFNEALKINPKNIRSWDNKAFALYGLGRFEEVIGCLDEILKIDSKNESAWNHKGEILAQGYSFKGGKKFKGCYRKGPKAWVEAWDNWQPKYEEAMKCYNKVLEINSTNIYAWREKGLILEDYFGKPEEAVKCYDEILKINSKNIEGLSCKASALKDIGEEFLKWVSPQSGRSGKVKDEFGKELFVDYREYGEKKYKEAMKCYDKILKIDSKNTDVWLSKGGLLYYFREYSKAIRCFDKALDTAPKNPSFRDTFTTDEIVQWNERQGYVWYKKTESFLRIKKYKIALKCINESLDKDSMSSVYWGLKGDILEVLGKESEAQKCFDKKSEMIRLYQ